MKHYIAFGSLVLLLTLCAVFLVKATGTDYAGESRTQVNSYEMEIVPHTISDVVGSEQYINVVYLLNTRTGKMTVQTHMYRDYELKQGFVMESGKGE